MSYTSDMKKFEREYKKRIKKEKKEYLLRQQKEEEYKLKLYWAMKREEEENNIKMENERIEKINKNYNFLQLIAPKVSYKTWLLYRDIVYNGFIQIKDDLIRNRITLEDINYALIFLSKENMINENDCNLLKEIIIQ